MKIYDKLISKDEKLAVVGLGYVGLPIALEFAKKLDVIGFDINAERVNLMKQNIDPSNELIASDFENCSITFTSNLKDLQEQLQESYKRVDELIKEIHELKRMAEEQR